MKKEDVKKLLSKGSKDKFVSHAGELQKINDNANKEKKKD